MDISNQCFNNLLTHLININASCIGCWAGMVLIRELLQPSSYINCDKHSNPAARHLNINFSTIELLDLYQAWLINL